MRVPGSAQSPLGDAALAGVLNWMIREFGPAETVRTFAPFTAAEIASYGRAPLTDVESRRNELLYPSDRSEPLASPAPQVVLQDAD